MPKVSVIVPNYNHKLYLQQRIESVLNQTYQDFELILLDDCSTDNSREVLLQYRDNPKVTHIVFNEQNSGSPFKQWNRGIKLAVGEYIWVAESDDWADVDFLNTIVFEFERRPNVGLIYTASKLIDSVNEITFENEQTDLLKVVEYNGADFINQKLSLYNSIWNASMMMFRKSIYPNASGQQLYSEMKYCGDWFFYILLSEQMDVLEIKKTLNYFRIHSENVSGKSEKSGLTFIEGLDIYAFVRKNFTFVERLKTSIEWTKNYNKYKYRYAYSRDTKKIIQKKFKKDHKGIFLLNPPFSMFYSLKKSFSLWHE